MIPTAISPTSTFKQSVVSISHLNILFCRFSETQKIQNWTHYSIPKFPFPLFLFIQSFSVWLLKSSLASLKSFLVSGLLLLTSDQSSLLARVPSGSTIIVLPSFIGRTNIPFSVISYADSHIRNQSTGFIFLKYMFFLKLRYF